MTSLHPQKFYQNLNLTNDQVYHYYVLSRSFNKMSLADPTDILDYYNSGIYFEL